MTRQLEPDPLRLIAAHEAANTFYIGHLQGEPRALAYLRSRGIMAATAHTPPWTIGYAPRGWTHLREHLRAAGFTDAELLAAGLVTTAGNGNLIDVFRNRVMFPIRDPDGHIVAFTGRDLSGRANTPKYRNTTTTAIYRKKHLLYGMAEQLGGNTQPAAVMLVEGPADVVAVARLRRSLGGEEYRQPYAAVAPCGTALTAEQVARLTDAVPPDTPLVVAFDADAAGRAAIDKSYQVLRGWPGPLDAIALPTGTDPAGLVAKGRTRAVQALEKARRPLVDHLIDTRLARFRLDEIPGRFNALYAAAPLVAAIRDTEHAARLSAHLATRLDLDPLTVFEAIYPPDDTTVDPYAPTAQPPTAVPGSPYRRRTATPLGGAGFPDPDQVGHQYARICPPTAVATTWVEHDPATGHTAWVIAEGVTDDPGDRDAARLAAEVAGRAAVLVGAHNAVDIARTALNAHFAQPGAGRGDATIAIVTSFDGDRPVPGRGRFTVAWAGDTRVYGATSRWFAPLTVDHTLHGQSTRRHAEAVAVPGEGALTASVRGGTIGVNRIDLPVTHLVIAGRTLSRTALEKVREAVEQRTPVRAVQQLARIGGASIVALVVRPRQAGDRPNAAKLAQQDQAASAVAAELEPAPTRPTRRALLAAPARLQPVR